MLRCLHSPISKFIFYVWFLDQHICFQWWKNNVDNYLFNQHYPVHIFLYFHLHNIQWQMAKLLGICCHFMVWTDSFVANLLLFICFCKNCVDRVDRANSLGNDLEKNQHALSRSVPVTDHGDAGSSNLNENHYTGYVALEGCSNSVASQLLNDRMYPNNLLRGNFYLFTTYSFSICCIL